MPYDSLGDFLAVLQDTGDVVRVAAPVDAAEEIAAITSQVTSAHPDGGPVLVFANVRNSSFPVVTNVLGNSRRICKALGISHANELAQRWTDRGAASADARTGWLPRSSRQAPAQQVIRLGRDVNLFELPIPRHTGEANPVIHAGLLVLGDPHTGQRFLERVPVQVLDRARLALHFPKYGSLADRLPNSDRQWPAAIVLGGDPLHAVAAETRTWPQVPEGYAWEGCLRGKGIETARCRSHDLEIPAHAEWVIEGFLHPAGLDAEPAWEEAPPVALSGGRLGRGGRQPVVLVSALTHRANPLLPATIWGASPQEEYWLRQTAEQMFLPQLQQSFPELVDWHAPPFGRGEDVLFVSLRPQYPGHPRQLMHALWGHPRGKTAKFIVVVDAEVNVHQPDAVWSAVAANVDAERDTVRVTGPAAADDFNALNGLVGKIGIDATRKDSSAAIAAPPAELRQRLRERWTELGLPPRWGETL